jgi:DNA-binding MarR family transcriptional regulator
MRQGARLQPLNRSVGYALKQATTALHNAMATSLRPLGLTVPQYSCLELLSQKPEQSNAQLARGMFITPQSMNDVLRGLQSRALVERPDEPAVGRARPTKLTAAGQAQLARARDALAPIEQRMLAKMRAADQEQLLVYLRSITDSLEHRAEDADSAV